MERKVIIEINGKKTELILSGPGIDRFGSQYDEKIISGKSTGYMIAPKITKEENEQIIKSIHFEVQRIFQNAIDRGTFLFIEV